MDSSATESLFSSPEGYSREKYQQNDLQIDYLLCGISAS